MQSTMHLYCAGTTITAVLTKLDNIFHCLNLIPARASLQIICK